MASAPDIDTADLPEQVLAHWLLDLYQDGWRRGTDDLWRNDRFGGSYKIQNAMLRIRSDRGEETRGAEDLMEGDVGPDRRKLPETRNGITHDVWIGVDGETQMHGYIIANPHADGSLGEVFLKFGKDGSTTQGFIDSFAILLSIGIQYGVELDMLARKFGHMRFEPYGETDNPDIPRCWSVPDYVFKWLALNFGDEKLREELSHIDDLMANEKALRGSRDAA